MEEQINISWTHEGYGKVIEDAIAFHLKKIKDLRQGLRYWKKLKHKSDDLMKTISAISGVTPDQMDAVEELGKHGV